MKNNNHFYEDLESLKNVIITTLNNYSQSITLQKYFYNKFQSFVYANLIFNFFSNLTKNNISEYKIPKGKIDKIRKHNKQLLSEVRLALSSKPNQINSNTYLKFKRKLKKDFPEHLILLDLIEHEVNLTELTKYLKRIKKEIQKAGNKRKNINDFILTAVIEVCIKVKGNLPLKKDYHNLMKAFKKDILFSFSEKIRNSLDLKGKSMLKDRRSFQEKFESRLYKRWEKAIDLFECLIKVCEETGENQSKKLVNNTNKTNNFKYTAIIKIHARALQIAKEILTLVKSGYADGANARWRSLHELSVIALFLSDNSNDVSERYLDHAAVKSYKEAEDYKLYHRKLGYAPIPRKELHRIKKDYYKMISKYGKEFKYKGGFGWIPEKILANRDFRELEKIVKVDHLHPFYNMSCNSVHGGAKGFYRLGLIDSIHDNILLAGSSNYGLSDPIHNTAYSLVLISVCLLCLEPDFESLIHSQILNSYPKNIGSIAENIQNQLEEEEKKIIRNNK